MGSVAVMRLAIYGLVALLAAGVFAARATRASSEDGGSAMYHGQSREGLLAAATVSGGKVEGMYLRWKMTCAEDRTPEVSTIRFGPQYGDRFEHRGRAFSFSGTSEQEVRRGSTIRYDVTLTGRVSADGRTIEGRGQTTETWLRGGRVVDLCRSERVPWTLHRGAVRD